jgi:hypothetical protein
MTFVQTANTVILVLLVGAVVLVIDGRNARIRQLEAQLASRPVSCPAPIPATGEQCAEWLFNSDLTKARERMCGKHK